MKRMVLPLRKVWEDLRLLPFNVYIPTLATKLVFGSPIRVRPQNDPDAGGRLLEVWNLGSGSLHLVMIEPYQVRPRFEPCNQSDLLTSYVILSKT